VSGSVVCSRLVVLGLTGLVPRIYTKLNRGNCSSPHTEMVESHQGYMV
jgi:hypothetical protein